MGLGRWLCQDVSRQAMLEEHASLDTASGQTRPEPWRARMHAYMNDKHLDKSIEVNLSLPSHIVVWETLEHVSHPVPAWLWPSE